MSLICKLRCSAHRAASESGGEEHSVMCVHFITKQITLIALYLRYYEVPPKDYIHAFVIITVHIH